MKKERFTRNLTWLRKVGAIDAQGERVLKGLVKRYDRFLIVGNHLSGKNSVQDVILNYCHQLDKELLVLPTLQTHTLAAALQSATWGEYQKILGRDFPATLALGHAGRNAVDAEEELFPVLARKFDVVFDVRRLADGRRALCQILVNGPQGLRPVYRNKSCKGFWSPAESRAA